MVNLIMQGRDLAIDVAESSRSWFLQQHDFLRSLSPLRGDTRTSNKQTMPDTHELAESTPGLRRYVVARFPWFWGGDRGAHPMLDARIPLREALEMMPVPVLAIDHRGKITFANAKTMELFGYTREELAGASAEVLLPNHAVCDNHLAVEEAGVEGRIVDVSRTQALVARRRDGADFPIEVNITTYRHTHQVLQIMAILDRSTSGEVDRSHVELEHLARVASLGELAGSLVHELKQPLTAILFNAQASLRFMESQVINTAELRDALEDIVADNCRANELMQKIRTLIRKGDIELHPLDVGDVVRDVAHLVHGDAMARGVCTRFDIADNLAMVCGDRVQLQQVVLNVLLNAFDAVKERALTERRVETSVREEPDGGVRITVKDWGLGLSVDEMHKIFRAFFTTKPQGLGLGLSISRTIITDHGGRLWAENNDGKGASFHITLPPATRLRQDGCRQAP